MSGRRTIVGLCVLCALALSVAAAQNAAAATNGTTAFTCAAASSGAGFSDVHCKNAVGIGASFKHVAIAENTATEIQITNAKTSAETTAAEVWKTKFTSGGLAVILTATGVSGTGTLVNKKTAAGEHYVHKEFTLTFTGVTANHGCTVFTDIDTTHMGEVGVIHTEPLTATTEGQGDFVKIQPKTGNVFKRFYLTECEIPGLNGTYTVTGSVKGVPNGATLNFTHVATTAQGTLFVNGTIPLGAEGSLTTSGRANSAQVYTPISVTTVET